MLVPPTSSGQNLIEFEVLLPWRRNPLNWLVNIDHASLTDLLTAINAQYQSSLLDSANKLKLQTCTGSEYSPQTDDALRVMLQFLVSKNIPKFTVVIEKLKAYSSYKSLKDLSSAKYGITSNNISEISQFSPGKFLSNISPQDNANIFPSRALKFPMALKKMTRSCFNV